jgi:hypothetical protein
MVKKGEEIEEGGQDAQKIGQEEIKRRRIRKETRRNEGRRVKVMRQLREHIID